MIEAGAPPKRRVVSVLPDVSGIDRTFAYAVPDELSGAVGVGTVVRLPLQGRRVRGWVLGDVAEPEGVVTRELFGVVSVGPDQSTVDLCRFGAWRYAGRLRPFLVAATPPRAVKALTERRDWRNLTATAEEIIAAATKRALGAGSAILRLPPAASRLDVVVAARAATTGALLVLVPDHDDAAVLTRRLTRLGADVAALADGWADAATGAPIVVGTRSAVWGRIPDLGAIVVLDAHAEAYAEQRAPTWDATVIATERARRAGVPCVLVSPCPSVVLLANRALVTIEPPAERAGWAAIEVLDRRDDDPRSGLFSPALGETLRRARLERPELPVICVLNRTGRARLLACSRCRQLVRCEHCGAALTELGGDTPPEEALSCPVCRATRPAVCAHCGATRLSRLRLGTARVAEELSGLVGESVGEVSSAAGASVSPETGVLVGTEAVLHRRRAASVVAFLDFDQELLAPRYRAGEQALVLLARAARLVGRRGQGRVVVQTRLPDDEVIAAAARGDPGRFAVAELARRRALFLPPARALAEMTGEGAKALADTLGAGGVEVAELGEGRFLIRETDPAALADALASAGVPNPEVRVGVDPVR